MTTRHDAFGAKRVMASMTRPKSLTLTHRQRCGKRVICVIGGETMTRTPKDDDARARVWARKSTSRRIHQTRHGVTRR